MPHDDCLAWAPGRIETVLLPLGTLEPHGVTANGADILVERGCWAAPPPAPPAAPAE